MNGFCMEGTQIIWYHRKTAVGSLEMLPSTNLSSYNPATIWQKWWSVTSNIQIPKTSVLLHLILAFSLSLSPRIFLMKPVATSWTAEGSLWPTAIKEQSPTKNQVSELKRISLPSRALGCLQSQKTAEAEIQVIFTEQLITNTILILE